MTEHVARCPFCVNVVRLERSFLERLGLRAGRHVCPACRRAFEPRDARMMGATFGPWMERFTHDLTALLQALPILPDARLPGALGHPAADELKVIPSMDELLRICGYHNRSVLVEMARGRDATLQVALVYDDAGQIEAAAVVATSSTEAGAREAQQVITRNGGGQFVLSTRPWSQGVEPRIKHAVQAKLKVKAADYRSRQTTAARPLSRTAAHVVHH